MEENSQSKKKKSLRFELKFTTMKTWIFVFISIRIFVEGVEEFFILPTAWFYIESLGQSNTFLALVVSAFSISTFFSGPIIGRLADRFGHIKSIIITCFMIQIVGSVIYAIPISAIFPLVGRFVSGIGNGAGGVFYAIVVVHTNSEYGTKALIFLDGMFTLGAVFGPSMSSFIHFNANILGWKINDGNSPAVILAIIWCIMGIVAFFLPDNLGDERTSSRKTILSDEDIPGLMLDSSMEARKSNTRYSSIFCLFYQMFFCVVYSIIAMFYAPLLAHHLLHFQFIHIKLLFVSSSLYCLVIFLTLYLASEYFEERTLMVFLNFMQLPAFVILTNYGFYWNEVSMYGIQAYIIILYVCFGMPFFQYSLISSILAKITDPKDAAFYQGSCYAIGHLAAVVGRMVSGYIFSQTPILFYCLGITLSWFLGALWFYFEYRNLGTVHMNI